MKDVALKKASIMMILLIMLNTVFLSAFSGAGSAAEAQGQLTVTKNITQGSVDGTFTFRVTFSADAVTVPEGNGLIVEYYTEGSNAPFAYYALVDSSELLNYAQIIAVGAEKGGLNAANVTRITSGGEEPKTVTYEATDAPTVPADERVILRVYFNGKANTLGLDDYYALYNALLVEDDTWEFKITTHSGTGNRTLVRIPTGLGYEVYEVNDQGEKIELGGSPKSGWKLISRESNQGIITADTQAVFTNEQAHHALTIQKETVDNVSGAFPFRIQVWGEEETEAYAMINWKTGVMTFFRDELGKYTNEETVEINEEKIVTYYTGVETTGAHYTNEGTNQSNVADSQATIPWQNDKIIDGVRVPDSYAFANKNIAYHPEIRKVVFQDVIRPESTYGWFFNMRNLEEIEGLEKLDTSKVQKMNSMFEYCVNLKSVDVSHFDTSNVVDMIVMFGYCASLQTIKGIENFITSNVVEMGTMFRGCSGLTSLDVSHFDTSKVTRMNGMFSGCTNLTQLDVSHFDTSSLINMQNMFNQCQNLDVRFPIMNPDMEQAGRQGSLVGLKNMTLLYTQETKQFVMDWVGSVGSAIHVSAEEMIMFVPPTVPATPAAQELPIIKRYMDLTSVQGISATNEADVYTFTLSNGGSITIPDIPYGYKYRVEELTPNGWKLISVNGDASLTAAAGALTEDTTATFLNVSLHTLTICKKVDGSPSSGSFAFTIASSALKNETLKTGGAQDVVFDADGKAAVVLDHGGSLTISGIPRGTQVSIAETGSLGKDFTTAYIIQAGSAAAGELTDGNEANVTLTGDVRVEFTNTPIAQTLTVEKNTLGADGTFSFEMDLWKEGVLGVLSAKNGTYTITGGYSSIDLTHGATTGNTSAWGNNATAVGPGAKAYGDYSLAMGDNTDALGDYTATFGSLGSSSISLNTPAGDLFDFGYLFAWWHPAASMDDFLSGSGTPWHANSVESLPAAFDTSAETHAFDGAVGNSYKTGLIMEEYIVTTGGRAYYTAVVQPANAAGAFANYITKLQNSNVSFGMITPNISATLLDTYDVYAFAEITNGSWANGDVTLRVLKRNSVSFTITTSGKSGTHAITLPYGYHYEVYETNENGNRIAAGQSPIEGWQLKSSADTEGKSGESTLPDAVFTNVINPVTVDPPVEKKVSGKDAPEETFRFRLTGMDGAPMPEGSAENVKTATVMGAGSVEFGEIVYNDPGVYLYTIEEIPGETEAYNYDSTVWTLKVTVSMGNAGLIAEKMVTAKDGETGETAVFENVYVSPTPGSTATSTAALIPTPTATSAPTVTTISTSISTPTPMPEPTAEPTAAPTNTPRPTAKPTDPSAPTDAPNYFYFSFTKEWLGDPGEEISFTLYNSNGTVHNHRFNRKKISDTEWLYEAWLSTSDDYYVIEERMSDYSTRYVNIGTHAEDTARAYNGGKIINSVIPKTGDSSNPVLWGVLAGVAVIALGMLLILSRKKKNRQRC